jgi:hypothetical protein
LHSFFGGRFILFFGLLHKILEFSVTTILKKRKGEKNTIFLYLVQEGGQK